MDEYITRAEHGEFLRRMDIEHQRLEDEDKRQNRRLDTLEGNVKELSKLASSVEKLATNMEHMLEELRKQGSKLEALEARDGEKWRKAVWYVATAVMGVVLGVLAAKIGL